MSLDQDLDTGRFLLSIPLFDGNRQYLESYELTPEEYELVSQDAAARQALTAKCRARENDGHLTQPLPPVRGEPCVPDHQFGSGLIDALPLFNGRQFRPLQVFWKEQFSLEIDQVSGKLFIIIRANIPNAPSEMTYNELYKVADEETAQVCHDPAALI